MFRYPGKDETVVDLSPRKLICLCSWTWRLPISRFSPPTPLERILSVARPISLIRFTCCEKRSGQQGPKALAAHDDDDIAEVNLWDIFSIKWFAPTEKDPSLWWRMIEIRCRRLKEHLSLMAGATRLRRNRWDANNARFVRDTIIDNTRD